MKHYELYDKYESMENDIQHAFRLPHQLRDDFNSCAPNAAKTLRRLMIDYIAENKKIKNTNT